MTYQWPGVQDGPEVNIVKTLSAHKKNCSEVRQSWFAIMGFVASVPFSGTTFGDTTTSRFPLVIYL